MSERQPVIEIVDYQNDLSWKYHPDWVEYYVKHHGTFEGLADECRKQLDIALKNAKRTLAILKRGGMMSETDAKVNDPPVEFWALSYREKGQRKLLYSFDGPVSPRYGAYILKSAYEKLQAQAAQFNKERDIWHENRKEMAKAYVELKEKLQAAEAEIERLRHGHYKDDHRFHPLKVENDSLRAEIERLKVSMTEHAKDLEVERDALKAELKSKRFDAAIWETRIQDAERKLEEALAREKRDVKHSLELADGNAELLKWCNRLAKFVVDAQCECSVAERVGEIRERLNAATPGPWIESHKGDGHYNKRVAECLVADVYAKDEFDINQGYANAELIAHAPTDISRLLSALELAIQQRDSWAKWAESVSRYNNSEYSISQDNAAIEKVLEGK